MRDVDAGAIHKGRSTPSLRSREMRRPAGIRFRSEQSITMLLLSRCGQPAGARSAPAGAGQRRGAKRALRGLSRPPRFAPVRKAPAGRT